MKPSAVNFRLSNKKGYIIITSILYKKAFSLCKILNNHQFAQWFEGNKK